MIFISFLVFFVIIKKKFGIYKLLVYIYYFILIITTKQFCISIKKTISLKKNTLTFTIHLNTRI